MTQALSGILNVDKPLGWTSHDVVALVRHLFGTRQVGHAGTLDPLATGVLLVCVGPATRLSDYLMHTRKCYLASLVLGATTTTDDREGEVVDRRPIDGVTRRCVLDILPTFVGAIEQIPPAFSAIKVGGVAAYRQARRGLSPELAPRKVRVEGLAVTAFDAGMLTMLVWCSTGTYIRSLARDIGEALGCGAHLAALRRLGSGGYTVSEAKSVDSLRQLASAGQLPLALAPMDRALSDWPVVILDGKAISQMAHGGLLAAPAPRDGRHTGARLMSSDGRLLALAEYDVRRLGWQPRKVLDTTPPAREPVPRASTGAETLVE
jgi:tRNA pseudouridine55 synthase